MNKEDTQEENPRDSLPVIFTFGSPNMVPFLEKLDDDYRLAVLQTLVGNVLKDMGHEIATIEDIVSSEMISKARNDSLWLTHNIMDDVISKDNYGVDWLADFTFVMMSQTIVRIMAIEEVINEYNIRGVLLHEDVSVDGRLLADAGHRHQVPVLHMPHANHFIAPGTSDIHCSSRSDYLGVRGEYMKRWYEKCGVPSDRIEIIGAPELDRFYDTDKMPGKEHARKAFGFEDDKFTICYTTSWAQNTGAWGNGQEDLFTSYKYVLQAVKDMDAQLAVKLHPHEGQKNAERYLTEANDAGVEAMLTSRYNEFMPMLADIMVVQGSSNIAVESYILGTPVVEMYQAGTRFPPEYNIPGSWGPDLVDKIDEARTAGLMSGFLEDMNVGPGSTERALIWAKDKYGN